MPTQDLYSLPSALLALLALAAVQTVLTLRTLRIPAPSPHRLVAELRLAQFAAVVLAVIAGALFGIASTETSGDVDVILAVVFVAAAALAPLRDPREALTLLALAFVGHAILDILHRPGALPADLVPPRYLMACAIHNAYAGALCYLPLLRR